MIPAVVALVVLASAPLPSVPSMFLEAGMESPVPAGFQSALEVGAEFADPAGFQSALEVGTEFAVPAGFQSALEVEAGRFARAWGAGDAQALGRSMNPAGIRLHLPGEEHMLIQPRQAQAALRTFMGRYPGGDARVTRVSLAGGDPRKGFAEIRWRTRAQGMGEPAMFTLFVAYSLEDESWLVTEIRVLF